MTYGRSGKLRVAGGLCITWRLCGVLLQGVQQAAGAAGASRGLGAIGLGFRAGGQAHAGPGQDGGEMTAVLDQFRGARATFIVSLEFPFMMTGEWVTVLETLSCRNGFWTCSPRQTWHSASACGRLRGVCDHHAEIRK